MLSSLSYRYKHIGNGELHIVNPEKFPIYVFGLL
jgi:hypothetical protein